MSDWRSLLRSAREGTDLSRRALSEAAGVSEDTIYTYEERTRLPQRETLLRLIRAMRLDGTTTNAILQGAGLAPEPSPWLVGGQVQHRPLAELPADLAAYPWPTLAFNERFELIAWNEAAVIVGEFDFGTLADPRMRNLLRIAAMKHFYDRAENWWDIVGLMVGMYKNHHMGSEELGEGSAYFNAVVADIIANDTGRLGPLIKLWQDAPPRPQQTRFTYPVHWKTSDDTLLHFLVVVTSWSEFDGVGIHDWMPVDSATWSWIERRRQRPS